MFRAVILACNLVVIPTCPGQYDIWACGETIEVLKQVRDINRDIHFNKPLPAYFVLNHLIPNTMISAEVEQALNDFAEDVKLMNSHLKSFVAIKTSISNGLVVSEYEPDGKAGLEIKALYEEIKGLLEGEK